MNEQSGAALHPRDVRSRHGDALRAFAATAVLASMLISAALPAVSLTANLALRVTSAIEAVGALVAGLAAALWVERDK